MNQQLELERERMRQEINKGIDYIEDDNNLLDHLRK